MADALTLAGIYEAGAPRDPPRHETACVWGAPASCSTPASHNLRPALSPTPANQTVAIYAGYTASTCCAVNGTSQEYRPAKCRCGCTRLHIHGLRERHPRQFVVDGEPVPVVTIVVFICAACGATWRVLPAFLARLLWRTWDVVEREVLDKPRPRSAPPVPARTVQRWRSRLAQSARLPVQVLVVAGGELRRLAERVGLDATRMELLLAWGGSLAALVVLLHRLYPGVRLM